MRPPANRNCVPEDSKASQPRPPTFYHAQPQFHVAPMSMHKAQLNTITQMGCIPQPHTNNVSLPLREISELRRVYRGTARSYDRGGIACIPPKTLSGIGADLESRTNRGNYDPKQRGLAVTSY